MHAKKFIKPYKEANYKLVFKQRPCNDTTGNNSFLEILTRTFLNNFSAHSM